MEVVCLHPALGRIRGKNSRCGAGGYWYRRCHRLWRIQRSLAPRLPCARRTAWLRWTDWRSRRLPTARDSVPRAPTIDAR